MLERDYVTHDILLFSCWEDGIALSETINDLSYQIS